MCVLCSFRLVGSDLELMSCIQLLFSQGCIDDFVTLIVSSCCSAKDAYFQILTFFTVTSSSCRLARDVCLHMYLVAAQPRMHFQSDNVKKYASVVSFRFAAKVFDFFFSTAHPSDFHQNRNSHVFVVNNLLDSDARHDDGPLHDLSDSDASQRDSYLTNMYL